MKMQCPRCEAPLAKRWNGKAHYQACKICEGIAITGYALAQLATPAQVRELWLDAEGRNETTQAACPSCLRPMRLGYLAPTTHREELDVCRSCRLIWFDRGELQPELPSRLQRRVEAQAELEKALATQWADEYGVGTVVLAALGLPVEENAGLVERTPYITLGLLLLAIGLSVLGFTYPEAMLEFFAYRSDGNFQRMLFTGISSFFFHAGVGHLLGNMYFLWVFGDDVENELGHFAYFALIATATLAGNFFYGFTPNAGSIPAIGASGGISGLLAFYMIRYPRRRFRLMIFYQIFTVSAWIVVGLYVLKDIIGAAAQLAGYGRVSHLSHLGGAAVGILWAAWAEHRGRQK